MANLRQHANPFAFTRSNPERQLQSHFTKLSSSTHNSRLLSKDGQINNCGFSTENNRLFGLGNSGGQIVEQDHALVHNASQHKGNLSDTLYSHGLQFLGSGEHSDHLSVASHEVNTGNKLLSRYYDTNCDFDNSTRKNKNTLHYTLKEEEDTSNSWSLRSTLASQSSETHNKRLTLLTPVDTCVSVSKSRVASVTSSRPSPMSNASLSMEINKEASHDNSDILTNDRAPDDLSTLMFKGATDLRNAKLALQEQTKELQRTQEELGSVVEERNTLRDRVMQIKKKSKEALEKNSKSLVELNNVVNALKSQAHDAFEYIRNTRDSMPDIVDLRATVRQLTQRTEGIVDENGLFLPAKEWEELFNDIRSDVKNKQQVIDLFRDRLEFVQVELADAKSRNSELEHLQVRDAVALKASSENIVTMEGRLLELAESLSQQQVMNNEVLSKSAELEGKNTAYEIEVNKLRGELHEKDEQLKAVTTLREEMLRLQLLVVDREQHITAARDARDELSATIGAIAEGEKRNDAQCKVLEEQKTALEESQKSLYQVEARLAHQSAHITRLENDLKAAHKQIDSGREANSKLGVETNNLKESEKVLQNQLDNCRKQLEESRLRGQQSDTRYEMLQEHFADQGMMLRMEKKALGDLQERFLLSETTYARTVEASKRQHDTQVRELIDQIKTLENSALDIQRSASASAAETENKISEVERVHAQKLSDENKRMLSVVEEAQGLQKSLDDAKAELQILRNTNVSLQDQSKKLSKDLEDLKLPARANQEEIAELRKQVLELRCVRDTLTQRAETIVSRLEKGDLSNEEKKLIETVNLASQTNYEHLVAEKGNEIRKRDNAIKVLAMRKSELESQLARVLNTQPKARAKFECIPTDGDGSLIDADSWMLSQASSSPNRTKLQALDGNIPTTLTEIELPDADTTMVALPPIEVSNKCVIPSSQFVTPACPTSRLHISPPSTQSFTNLALTMDDSDEINEIDTLNGKTVFAAKRKRDSLPENAEGPENLPVFSRSMTGNRTTQKQVTSTRRQTTRKKETSMVAPKMKGRRRK